ncbi:proline transporter 1-like isoform X1 [Phragmites australis]|uniref:proline transporter 1-like isoform X1 n=1 Tax=Phragmites australis TaxID=29695 RepID=UPI002D77AFA0|nr:proline transporter 1-like isoform X1 [Phragmites australis]
MAIISWFCEEKRALLITRESMEAAVDKREAMASSPDNEAAGQELKGSGYTIAATAHAVDTDSWQQVGLLLVIGFNCAYVLSFSNLMMVPLGWGWGVACLLIVGGAAWYANWLLAGLHVIDGQRFIRYRDLMGFVFGRKMYYITWFLQFTTLLLCNMGFILLGARALKAINVEFTHSHARLQWFIAATGTIYFAFAYFVPTISAMRNWLATSAALTVAYDVALLAILVKDGKSDKPKDYTLHGTQAEKVFSALGAIAAILVCNTSGLLPEIQSTLRAPAVRGMRRALLLQYTAGGAVYYGVSVAGYWAYGSAVSEYLPDELGGPKWAGVLINAAAFLQSVVSQHLFTVPIHEAMDTQLQRLDEGMFSRYNLSRRLFSRGVIFGFNVFVTALFPFMGDFVNLFGSFALVPLTFMFPSMVVLKIKGKSGGRWHRVWHWGIIVASTVLGVATTAAAARLIFNNARVYHFFADM